MYSGIFEVAVAIVGAIVLLFVWYYCREGGPRWAMIIVQKKMAQDERIVYMRPIYQGKHTTGEWLLGVQLGNLQKVVRVDQKGGTHIEKSWHRV